MISKNNDQVIVGELCSPSDDAVLCTNNSNNLHVLYQQVVCSAVSTLEEKLKTISPETLGKVKNVKFEFGYQLVPNLKVVITPHD